MSEAPSAQTDRHTASPRKLMFLSEGIYFQQFFSYGKLGKWTAKEKLFHVVVSRTVSHPGPVRGIAGPI